MQYQEGRGSGVGGEPHGRELRSFTKFFKAILFKTGLDPPVFNKKASKWHLMMSSVKNSPYVP